MADTDLTSDAGARLREAFDVLSEMDAPDREAWLAANVADPAHRETLRRLLAEDDARGFLDESVVEHAKRMESEEIKPEGMIGRQIGMFRIVRLLGQGGMASVFLGERIGRDFQQKVAVKILRRGLFSELEQRLFLRERRVLAALNHPNIARLIDGGVTDSGIPYLVMEYVDGEPITRYAALCELDVRHRAKLFLTVCRAVEAAHRNLVVHRDIKPSNVLVSTDGAVKLLDFGIAKLIEEDDTNATGTVGVFTPNYAAPEQIRGGAITTATDVYSLGVLLHELLLGIRPEGSTRRPSSRVTEAMRTISGNATTRVTNLQLRSALRGDLDNILLKALAEEPERRYPSAGAFADDIERYLSGRPVSAHPPSGLYRARKFAQRHRGGVALSALFLAALLGALITISWQARVARQQAARAEAMKDFMVSAFAKAEPSVPRDGPPRITEVVEQAIAKARSETHMNESVRSELLTALGAVLRAQGRLAPALETLEWNYTQARASFGEADVLTLQAGHQFARALIGTGNYRRARTLVDDLLSRARNDDAERLHLLLDSAFLATKQDERQRALADSASGRALARKLGDADMISDALSESGNVQLSAGDVAGAVSTYEELLTLTLHEVGEQHLKAAAIHTDLSRAYRRQGRLDDAEREIRAALATDALVLPKDDWRHANHLNALTMILLARRDFPGALDSAVESLRIDRVAHGNDHPDVANDLNNVGMLYALVENYPAAATSLREALDLNEAKFGTDHLETAGTRANYGAALARAGQTQQGEAQILQALKSVQKLPEPDYEEQAELGEKLARVRIERGDAAAALPVVDQIEAWLAHSKPDNYWTGRAGTLRAAALVAQNRFADAKPFIDKAQADLARVSRPDPLLRAEVSLLQASVAAHLADAAAPKLAADARAVLAAVRNPPTRLSRLADTLPQPPAGG